MALILEQRGMIDRAQRQRALLTAQIEHLKAGTTPRYPRLDRRLQSTTAQLLDAISRIAQGAVVLPGLDRDLDDIACAISRGFRRPRRTFLHASAIHSKAPFAHHEHRPREAREIGFPRRRSRRGANWRRRRCVPRTARNTGANIARDEARSSPARWKASA